MIGIKKFGFALFLLLVLSLSYTEGAAALGVSAITFTDLVFPFVMMAWLASVALGHFRVSWVKAYSAFAIYFAALLISAIFSTNFHVSFQKLSVPVYLIALAVATSSIVSTQTRLKFTVLAWLAGSALSAAVAILAIALFYFGAGGWLLDALTYHSGAVPIESFPRVSSTFVSPAMFCNFLTVSLVIAFAAKRVGWLGSRTAAILIGLLTISAVFTFSIALGGFFLAAGICLWFYNRDKLLGKLALGIGVLIASASLFVTPFGLSSDVWSYADIAALPAAGESSRMMIWKESIRTFASHPITGSGIGTPAANVQYQNYDGSLSLLTDAHNTFLSLSAQAGLLGLISILIFIAAIMTTGLSQRSESKPGILRSAFAIAFLVAFVFQGLTGSFEDARHLWVLMGLIIAARKIEATSDDDLSTSLHGA